VTITYQIGSFMTNFPLNWIGGNSLHIKLCHLGKSFPPK